MSVRAEHDKQIEPRRAVAITVSCLSLIAVAGYHSACQCQPEKEVQVQEHSLVHEGDETLILYINNESASRPNIDIKIEIDGKEISHPARLERLDGHSRSEVRLNLPVGVHTLRAISVEGGAEFEKQFSLPDKRWAALYYSFNPERRSGNRQPYFTFYVRDEPIMIR